MTHNVVCFKCGTKFDVAKEGGRYFPNRERYCCRKCYKKYFKEPSAFSLWFKKYWKLVIGIILVIGGIGNVAEDIGAFICGVVVGAGLIVWHFLTIKKKKDEIAKVEKEIEEMQVICPNCGAATKGKVCEYCNSPLDK